MIISRKLLTICFTSIYLCVIYADTLLSATRKTSTRKKTSSKTNARKRSAAPNATKSLNNMMKDVVVPEEETSTPQATTTTNEVSTGETTTDTNNETTTSETTSESVNIEINLSEDQLYKTVPKHEKWEDFKFCMQQQCMGGPEQPANVECYNNLNFDNAFQSCKIMIGDASKYSLFEKYFKEEFLPEEQATACGSLFGGNWNSEKKTCDVAITFTRKYESKAAKSVRNSKVGCNDNKIKVVSIPTNGTSLKMNCSPEVFGLGPCYSDSAEVKANQMGIIMGSISVGVGATAGIAAGIVAGTKKVTETKTIRDKETGELHTETVTKQKAYKDRKTGEIKYKDETAGAWAGISAGLEASKGMILEGAGQIVQAKVSKNDVGELVQGTCKLPDNVVYSEGSVMQLSW